VVLSSKIKLEANLHMRSLDVYHDVPVTIYRLCIVSVSDLVIYFNIWKINIYIKWHTKGRLRAPDVEIDPLWDDKSGTHKLVAEMWAERNLESSTV